MSENKNAPAFPYVFHDREGDETVRSGLSKREYIAAQVMAALVSMQVSSPLPFNLSAMAKTAVYCADALLTELNENEQ